MERNGERYGEMERDERWREMRDGEMERDERDGDIWKDGEIRYGERWRYGGT